MIKEVFASDFASLADLAAFDRCKAEGKSDKQCFAVGDNGIGCWGDKTAQTHTPMCALPPETMIEWFGSIAEAKHKPILVVYQNHNVRCIVADRMPHLSNITNGCGIDLNPAALRELGLHSPVRISVTIGPILAPA